MLAFITSIRHPSNASDYAEVERLLSETLESVTRQTVDDFVVIVVGNRRPAFPLPKHTHFVPVDFPPPEAVDGPHAALASFVIDKGTKIGVGLIAARAYAPDYVMIFDADDFVHRGLARFAAERPGRPGWVVTSGWMYSRARDAHRKLEAFNRTCGTCMIVPFDAYEVAEELTVDTQQDRIVEAFGERLTRIMGAHRSAVDWYRDQGRELAALPFRGSVYQVDTGENHSGKRMTGIARPWRSSFGATYGIRRRERGVAALRSAAGPAAVGQSLRSLGRRALKRLRRSGG